ncbi:MAG: C13 family peptidase [Prevotellamassilia sp.]
MSIKNGWWLTCLLLLAFCGCADDIEAPTSPQSKQEVHTVAVIMPMSHGLDKHWKRTLSFLNRNMDIAFKGEEKAIKLRYELYDEDKEDMSRLADSLAKRKDIEAVVGCLYSDHAAEMITKLADAEKNFLTVSTSADLTRGNTQHGYLWSMVETDITQCEVLLSKALDYGAKRVSLLTLENNSYSQTFVDWFSFQAGELGLEVTGIHLYNEQNVTEVSQRACDEETDYIICVPATVEEVQWICEAFQKYDATHPFSPKKLFGDTAYGSDVINKYAKYVEGIEGVTFGADPESGFEVSYKTFFRDELSLGESQIYDACMMLYYGFWYQLIHANQSLSLKESLRAVVDGRDNNHYGWMGEDMRFVIESFANGGHPNITGASGSLDFDKDVYTSVLESTYANFMVYNGRYVTLGYYKSNGGRRSDKTLAGWNWKKNQIQDFSDETDIRYPVLQDKWALLVASSKDWKNYRHQADILSVYQMIRERGYPDDHIILIMEDDLAQNPKNPFKGEVKTDLAESNLYQNFDIDYKMSDLTPTDIMNILSGKKTSRTPIVIESTDKDNILIFWSGHGTQAELCWGDEFMGVRKEMVSNTLKQMAKEKKYRKMLFLIEACYSGSIVKDIQIPGALFITAANDKETSKADNFSNQLGVWMTNRFTYGLREQLETDMSVPLRDLYYRLFINTIGSHVMVYNTANFGNIHMNNISEFFLY